MIRRSGNDVTPLGELWIRFGTGGFVASRRVRVGDIFLVQGIYGRGGIFGTLLWTRRQKRGKVKKEYIINLLWLYVSSLCE